MNTLAEKELSRLATRYIWWKTPEEAMQSPRRVVAQVMNLGDFEDMRLLAEAVGEEELRETLRHAEIGESLNGLGIIGTTASVWPSLDKCLPCP